MISSSAQGPLAHRSRATLWAWLALLWAGCAAPTFDFSEKWQTPTQGMVVSEHPLATEAGVKMLEMGGNAADAAVATALALAVVYPKAGNLGGGGFALWVAHETDENPTAYDFRETAPKALTPELFLNEAGEFVGERSVETALGVGVPGSPRGLYELHRKHGELDFWRVARPAIDLARKGYEVDPELARALARAKYRERLLRHGMAGEIYYRGGRSAGVGTVIVQPELARTLELFVERGPDIFYRGAIGKRIVETVRAEGGVLSMEDMEAYQIRVEPPLRGWFRGLEILTMPPPSSGGVALLQVLSMLDGFPLDEERELTRQKAQDMGEPLASTDAALSGRALHWWIEAMRLAFADRAEHLGDPTFHEVPKSELLSPEHISERRISIGELANPGAGPMVLAPREGNDTTHISVLDAEGNAVSLTTTLNTNFGCGLMTPEFGILLNNEIDDFAIVAGEPNEYGLVGSQRGANAIEPGKRPLSSMTPTVVRDGGRVVRMVLGSPGGPRIITSVIQVLLRKEVYDQSLGDAVAAPRLHQQWNPSATFIEEGWDPVLLQRLRDRSHELRDYDGSMGSVQAIYCEVGGKPIGASDPRRGGNAQLERLDSRGRRLNRRR